VFAVRLKTLQVPEPEPYASAPLSRCFLRTTRGRDVMRFGQIDLAKWFRLKPELPSLTDFVLAHYVVPL